MVENRKLKANKDTEEERFEENSLIKQPGLLSITTKHRIIASAHA